MSGYARCLIPQAIGRELTYSVPEELEGRVARGVRVQVPLRGGTAVALVMDLEAAAPAGVTIKPVSRVIDEKPFYDEKMMAFLKWVGDYYLASPAQALRAALPAPARKPRKGVQSTKYKVQGCPERTGDRTEDPGPAPELTPHQKAALEPIGKAIEDGAYRVFLLHGITGSGKTEVYLHATERALERGRGVIVLVPEITLSYQIVELFEARFGKRVSVLHSRLTGTARAQALEDVRREPRIVVGARSAVFAPSAGLGLVVVDEEHEAAYKQEETPPFYHARECAMMRGKFAGCPVILGTATPSIETASRAKAGQIELLSLPERVDATPLPSVELVPMDREPPGTVIGRRLAEELVATVKRGEQALVFLNRRGFAPVMLCTACGSTAKCPRCSTNLVLHVQESSLKCHWCGESSPARTPCARCGAQVMRPLGLGTQRVETTIRDLLPRARLVRMDRDTTRRRQAHRELLESFTKGDILVGTQMIAKGLDFPRLTLVGVVLADLSLCFPDFRAAERTFQILTQVAGRAGRRDVQGRVIIQTFSPGHPAIRAAAAHDYWQQYEAERSARRALGYPPFGRMIRFKVSGKTPAAVESAARRLARTLEAGLPDRAAVLGPAPACPAVVARQHRWHLVLKGPASADLRSIAGRALARTDAAAGSSRVRITADVDPLNVMS